MCWTNKSLLRVLNTIGLIQISHQGFQLQLDGLLRDRLARSFSITLSCVPVGNPRPGICQSRLSWKGRVRAKAVALVLGPPFLPNKPGKKRKRERESTFQQVELPTPSTHTHTTRFFCKGEPWMRLTKGSCKSPSWPPSMSTALGVKGRTNYIHSQQTLLLYNTSCPSLAVAERERERERKVEFFLFQ